MRNLLKKLNEEISSGNSAVLVTVVASSGSTPRGAGARMLITKKGHICGTIGGGAVEYRSEQIAAEVLESKGSRNEHFRLHPNDVADIGMICGGNVDVYFKYIPENDCDTKKIAEEAEKLFEKGEQSWIITEQTEGKLFLFGKKSGAIGREIPSEVIESLEAKPVQCILENKNYYCERLVEAGKVYIFGGGHVAQQLVPTLARVNFTPVVIEDREDFTNPNLFENLCETRLIKMEDIGKLVPEITEDDYICVMTRGHKDDYEVQREMLKTPANYIGVIGSKHKIAGVNARLMNDGYTEKDIARITTPIGIDILSETPAEIAVSITAQLIEVRAKRSGAKRK